MKNNQLIPATAAILVIVALTGSVFSNVDVLPVFLSYWFALVVLLSAYMYRLRYMKLCVKLLKVCRCCPRRLLTSVERMAKDIQRDASVIYFTKTANICRLNKAMLYIIQNEDTDHVRIVHVYENEDNVPRSLVLFCQMLDTIYPSVKIDLVFVRGKFGAKTIMHLSREWGVAPCMMFITCPTSSEAGRRLQDFRGVRVIMGSEEEGILDSMGDVAAGPVELGGAHLSVRRDSNASALFEAINTPSIVSALVNHGLAREVSSEALRQVSKPASGGEDGDDEASAPTICRRRPRAQSEPASTLP
eukprot:TRINITY_DN22079_c0_g1_i5.p1 TRINITY_DN22079_c0_g1~~TRINITY_DN22079_c0_g1_i5.p1  ORF type:complete len:303 (+),score=60.98 TRINITY_DN22079_c0_g1_i5:350-1258(+)